MRWSPTPAAGLPDLIVFDGDCVLCSRWARWVHERDSAGRLRFVAMQSAAGQTLAARFGVDAHAPETNILVLAGVAYFKVDTITHLLALLPGWRWARALGLAPRVARDWLYDRLARNRYRWFGRRKRCLADPMVRARLIESAEDLANA